MKLLPHQIEDAKFLASRKIAGCFNGMGTGKTLTALQATIEAEVLRAVIIGPPISLRMWAQEAANWTGAKVQILAKGTTPIDRDPEVEILICSYEIATKRQHELMAWAREPLNGMRTALICDESHALKSTKAKRTKAVLGRGGMCEAFEHTWLLTGSPMTRWADDLIPFLFRAAPDQIKKKIGALSIERYNLRYCITQKRSFPGSRRPVIMTVGSRNLDELGAILATCATRRTLDDVWESMPSLTHTRLAVEVSGVSAINRQLEKMTMAEIEQALADKDENLATMRRELGLSMIPEAADFIWQRADAEQGAILVGAWHREVIDGLVDLLHVKKLRVAKLDGRTSAAMKTEIQRQFNEGELDVLVGQIAAMGVSLNLQRGGNSIVVVEEDWSPSVMDQFYARLHRMGQGKPVHVDTLYVENKLAKAVHNISNAKRRAHTATAEAHQEAAQ
jgi:SWI/SNF-related matrix-associated actin-dependent regulator of chromatin subfamily A-like protein 1